MFSNCPARVSSTKPMIAASEVLLIKFTENPTVGGIATRNACGSTTRNIRAR